MKSAGEVCFVPNQRRNRNIKIEEVQTMLQIKMLAHYSFSMLNKLINDEIKDLSDAGAEVLDVHFVTRYQGSDSRASLTACIKYKISEE